MLRMLTVSFLVLSLSVVFFESVSSLRKDLSSGAEIVGENGDDGDGSGCGYAMAPFPLFDNETVIPFALEKCNTMRYYEEHFSFELYCDDDTVYGRFWDGKVFSLFFDFIFFFCVCLQIVTTVKA